MSVDPLCFFGAPETLLHLFLECPTARILFHWFLSILQLFDPSIISIQPHEIFFGFIDSPQIPPCFTALLGIVRHQVWVTRNSATFDGNRAYIPEIISKVKSTFRFMLRIQLRHSNAAVFFRDWLAGGVVGFVTAHSHIRFSRAFAC